MCPPPQDEFGYDRQGSNAALDRPPNSPVPPKRVISDIISFRRVALDAPDGMPLVRGDMGGEGGHTRARVQPTDIHCMVRGDSRQALRAVVLVCLPASAGRTAARHPLTQTSTCAMQHMLLLHGGPPTVVSPCPA